MRCAEILRISSKCRNVLKRPISKDNNEYKN